MTQIQLEQTLLRKFRQLPESFQPIVLNLLDSLLALPTQSAQAQNEPSLMSLAGTLPDRDAQEMLDAVKDCRQIDYDEW